MSTKVEVKNRREQISLCLAKSMTSPSMIAKQLKLDVKTVDNDLRFMRKNARKWLSGHTLDGYVFETQKTIDQLKDIELELQEMRNKEPDVEKKLKIIHELKDVINVRWVIQGDGPTLMNSRFKSEYGR